MNRSTVDKLVSTLGLIVAVVLLLASFGLYFAHSFVHAQVSSQLSAQKITFPAANSVSLNALPEADKKAVSQYAGQQLLTGAQAAVFADNYIAVHLNTIGGGKTYSELSELAMTDPTNTALAGKVNTVFKGETLRGMLLNAYAFDTIGTISLIASFVALAGGIILAILSIFGFRHSKHAN